MRLFEAKFGLAMSPPPAAGAGGAGGTAAAEGAHRSAGAARGAAGDETECCVCMDGRKTHILMPCRHVCVCAGCASVIMAGSKACPMCRGVSTDCFEVYM